MVSDTRSHILLNQNILPSSGPTLPVPHDRALLISQSESHPKLLRPLMLMYLCEAKPKH